MDDSKEYKESEKPAPIYAQILMAEIRPDCLPKKIRKNDNDALGNIAMSFVSEPGLQHSSPPLWYRIGKQKIHMNSGVGRVIANGKVASAPIIVMSMTTKWRGHLLAWVFISDDIQTFNAITKSEVQFGKSDWGQMFPEDVLPKGAGTPMKILPK